MPIAVFYARKEETNVFSAVLPEHEKGRCIDEPGLPEGGRVEL
jgi:hypothetical protein